MSRAHGKKSRPSKDMRLPPEMLPGYYSVEEQKQRIIEVHIKSGKTTLFSFTGEQAAKVGLLTDEQILFEYKIWCVSAGKTAPKNARVERI